jgi:outer membrane protein OmpU
MKKHLLGTTALVAAGLFGLVDTAAAQTKVQPIQVSVGGYWAEYVSYTSQDDVGPKTTGGSGKLTKFDEFSDKEIHFNGRTTLDNGLTIGFRAELEANTESDQIDESYMFIEGRFGRLELGSINNVQYRMGYNAPEAQTRPWSNEGNIFNVLFNPTGSPAFDSMLGTSRSRFRDNDSEKVNYYTPRFEGFQLGVSYIPNSSQDTNGTPENLSTAYSRGWAVGANFVRTFGAFDVAASAGYMRWNGPQLTATTSAPDPDQWNVGLQLGYAGFKVGGSYGKLKDGRTGAAGSAGSAANASAAGTGLFKSEGKAYDAGIMYTFGPAAVSLNYIRGDNDDNAVGSAADDKDKFSMLSLAGKYTLGPGVSLEATLFHAKLDGNGSTGGTTTAGTAANTDNKATGGIVGVVLVF